MSQLLSSAAVVIGTQRVNLLKTRDPDMGTLANTEDPDEMQHNAAFHQGLHCLLAKINLQRKKFNFFWKL